jgi:ketosteroid isomerase-like protein
MAGRLLGVLLMSWLPWAAVAWSAGDEEAIEKVVRDAAKATAVFSETRDAQAVLKLYTKDYLGVQDGEAETREAIEKWLADYESELKQGSTLRFISVVSNLKSGFAGSVGWTTYDYVFQATRNGELEGQDVGKCTTLLRKVGSAWLIFHEHCSQPRRR